MDLSEYAANERLKTKAPLAYKMCPETLEDFFGQEHIVGKGKLLYRAIKADKISSIILYGPPGSGKTTLARIIANMTKNAFSQLNATMSGVKDIKETIARAKDELAQSGRRTILFIDEIHRFNKSQQDALLPFVENGTVILIGATTENPYFEVNKALISRSLVFELEPLSEEEIKGIILRAVEKHYKGSVRIDSDALRFLANSSNGDARSALNALELAVLTTEETDGKINIDLPSAEECIQKRALKYEKDGDNHYDTISAFIKSMRGSDPDAAVYYLAKMLYAGEDPKFIARRIIICASEDIGNADPHALQVAVSAAWAVNFIGMPEARIILSQAAIYIACSPKSNASYMAINAAFEDVKNITVKQVPPHLMDSRYKGSEKLKKGAGYKYAHDYPGHFVSQQYLPDELAGKTYYSPSNNGVEKKIKESLEKLKNIKL